MNKEEIKIILFLWFFLFLAGKMGPQHSCLLLPPLQIALNGPSDTLLPVKLAFADSSTAKNRAILVI